MKKLITYNNFINEAINWSENEYINILKIFFKKYIEDTEFTIDYNKYDNRCIIYIYLFGYSRYSTTIIFTIFKEQCFIEFFDNEYEFIDINEFKIYLYDNLSKIYYEKTYEFINDCNDLQQVVVLDKEEYSKLIFKLISKDKEYIKFKNIYYKYLTDNYKEKIEPLINASNFDLI
jgi:hypothetical protein